MTKLLYILTPLTLLFTCCADMYRNDSSYKIKVGETFNFYVRHNSCCENCWVDKSSIKTVILIEEKLIKSEPEDCHGCSSIYAWVFKGIKPGQDTLKFIEIGASDNCDSLKTSPEHFIITVE